MRTVLMSVLVSFVILVIPSPGTAATLNVPSQYGTIQQAIDAALDGDTVLVDAGIYMENIDFKGKVITVKSAQGPDSTTINGAMQGSVVTFKSNEGQDSVLEGFCLTNGTGTFYGGWADTGGGVYCHNSSPTITNNRIEENSADNGGGIVCLSLSNAKISNNVISDNRADAHGGGLFCDQSSPNISDNTISNNSSVKNGGGVLCRMNSHAEIVNNRIIDNTAGWPGGGIFVSLNSSTSILNNTISGNNSLEGGGIYCCKSCTPTLSCNLITENKGGGIIVCTNASALISNNVIALNTASLYCGGIGAWYSGDITVINNTVCFNTAPIGGGGLEVWDSSSAFVRNTIFWGDIETSLAEIYVEQNSTTDIDFSNVEGGMNSVYKDPSSTLVWGLSMIDADPLFVAALNSDFHLTYTSPCKDTGDNSSVTELIDFEGDPRIAYDTVDMGADEYDTHMYWTGNATPGGNVEIKFVGLPGISPVGLCIGTGVLDPPLKSMWGDWYLKFPIFGPIGLPQIPSTGVLVIPGTIPGTPPGPYAIPMQALIGAELSKLCVLEVK